MSQRIGILGGSGLYEMEGFGNREEVRLETPFGDPSDSFITGTLEGHDVVFLSRHGRGHRVNPSEINYRANIWGMKKLGVEWIVGVSAVGSMKEEIRPGDIVADVKDGIYAVGFGGGQVDITNSKFVFSCTEAYRVENGKIGAPVKGATLIGDGATAMQQIRAIGNDMALDPGIGNCGKAGQWVPVGVGQPTLLIGGLTVGGAAT